MTERQLSKRLVDQRLRNRIMEELLTVAEGDKGVREAGFVEYFEGFFDVLPSSTHDNSALTAKEKAAVMRVLQQVEVACDDTPKLMSEEEFISTGWPARLRPPAQEALILMLKRGRFSEEVEEAEPSSNDGWPWNDEWKTSSTS